MDNKISFFAGYILTAVSTISAAGILNAIVLGLLGGFFGLLGKEVYFLTREQVKEMRPSIIDWWSNLKIKVSSWIKAKVDWIKAKVSSIKK